MQTQHIPKSKRLYLFLGFAAIVVGVAVVLAVVLTSTWVPPNQTSTVIESPTQPPPLNASDTTESTEALVISSSAHTTDIITSLTKGKAQDESTPQGSALRWILEDTLIYYLPCDNQITQQYIVALL